jgi:hypothetical protein
MLTLSTEPAVHCAASAFDIHDGTKVNFVAECFGAYSACFVQHVVEWGVNDVGEHGGVLLDSTMPVKVLSNQFF